MASREDHFAAATKFLAPRHFHQSLWIPETDHHARLRVTFATTSNFAFGNEGDTSAAALPVMLFAGPMFGTRYIAVHMDRLSKENGVRGIFIDRPGFGGSTPVPLSQRVAVWIEAVPLVLAKLGVKHVAVFSHSAGTIYSLNTLGQLREILDPARPYVAFIGKAYAKDLSSECPLDYGLSMTTQTWRLIKISIAPYIHNDHSSAILTSILSVLPNRAISGWDGISRFVNLQLMPMSSWSTGALSSFSSIFKSKSSKAIEAKTDDAIRLGVSNELAKEVDRLMTQYIFAEGALGANDEARLCLKKGGKDLWGVAENFEHFVQSLAAREATQREAGIENAKLNVRVVFADSDVMSGEKGEKYFDHIWRQNEQCRQAFDVKSVRVPGTDHETVLMDHKSGGLSTIFAEVGSLHD